jgi:hypothetical protein
MKPRFTFLTGDVNWIDYGGKWISQKLTNGEFDYWLVLELINMNDACGRDNEGQPKYTVELCAVSPTQAAGELDKALESDGMDRTNENASNPVFQVECLHSYGVSAHLWSGNGNNAHKLIREAKHKAMESEFLFGFAMDRPVNRIGTTGWEAIKGDIMAGLARTISSGSTEGQILGKIYDSQS